MRRVALLCLSALILFAGVAAWAQQPVPTSTPSAIIPIATLPPIEPPTGAIPLETPEVVPPTGTTPIAPPTVAVPPTAVPTIVPIVTLAPVTPTDVPVQVTGQQLEIAPLLVNTRHDLELLATAVLGNSRPVGWTGVNDVNDVQLPILLRLDLELLATAIYGTTSRPDEYYGVVVGTPLALARDLRHDLELLADVQFPFGGRPSGWRGGDPFFRCSRAVLALVDTIRALDNLDVAAVVNTAQPDYCRQAELIASEYLDRNPRGTTAATATAQFTTGSGGGSSGLARGRFIIDSPYAVGFFDRKATERGGVIPQDTVIRIIGRSDALFSNMILVEGEGFFLWVEFMYTSITVPEFNQLTFAPDNPRTECRMFWCERQR